MFHDRSVVYPLHDITGTDVIRHKLVVPMRRDANRSCIHKAFNTLEGVAHG
jgi:hypothetical protein